jgi:predicted ATPase
VHGPGCVRCRAVDRHRIGPCGATSVAQWRGIALPPFVALGRWWAGVTWRRSRGGSGTTKFQRPGSRSSGRNHEGHSLIQNGRPAEGIAPLKAGIALWEATGGKARTPTLKAFLAEAMALTGDLANALQLIDEAIAQVERPGWEERIYYAEVLRLKGWILSLKGDLDRAEQNFLASLDWARRQQAKMWELRTSTSLARLWQSQGKGRDAYALLAPVYDWFTEGFDTKDLLEAKALLAELA